ncbi:MAG: hypothetical protein V4805_20805 [Pseudomonadota bacterium]
MSQIFDKSTLTPEQLGRWDFALEEYARVQEHNLRREYAATLDQGQSDADDSVRTQIEELMELIGSGGAGHDKSGLFLRLLDGKQSLPYPPPTSFAYPWYAIIEEPGPFMVMLGRPANSHDMTGNYTIAVNQSDWSVLSMNQAAQDLLALDQALAKNTPNLAVGDSRNKAAAQLGWTEELYASAIDAYRRQPEFLVQYAPWPPYRLALGRHEASSQRALIEDAISGFASNTGLAAMQSIFDEHALFLNASIGTTLAQGEHPRRRLENRQALIAAQAQEAGAGLVDLNLDQRILEQTLAALDQDEVAQFEARPDGHDFVQFSCDRWMLFKD